MKFLSPVLVTFLLLATTPAGAQAIKAPRDLVADGDVEAATELVFTEGPAYHRDGSVFFTDIANNRIMRLAPGAADAATFLRPSGRANGLMFDSHGFLIACEGNERGGLGGRRLSKIDVVSGARTVIVDRYEGKRFNSPNDLCIDERGRIYFTDPYYGPDRDGLELDLEGVYRVNPDGTGLVRVLGEGQVSRPNGIAISRDQKTLYVVDNQPITPVRKLWAFPLDDEGNASGAGKEFYDWGKGRGGDGMCIDSEDNLYVTGGADRAYVNQTTDNPGGVYVFSGEGKFKGVIKVPEDMVTNCCFGDADLKTLYITAGKTLWKVRVKVAGRLVWPR